MLLNVQSLRNKTDELSLFLNECDWPNVVLLTEHWLRENELVSIPNYVLLSKFCRSQSVHGGCMILVNEVFLKQNSFQAMNKFDYLLLEFVFEFAIIHSKSQNVFIICIYRSPSSDCDIFFVRLEEILSNISISASIILTGDFNINFDERSSACTMRLTSLFECHSLQMHINSPTRITRYSSTTIDYVCSNFCSELINCTVKNAALSDHEAILFNVVQPRKKTKPTLRRGRVFSSKNYTIFHSLCSSSCWNSTLESVDPIQSFHTRMVELFNRSFPLTIIKPKNPSKKEWFTKGLTISSRNLRCLHTIRKFITSAGFDNYFTKYRSIFRRLVKLCKTNYYSKRLNNCANSQKECWKVLNDIRRKNAYHPSLTPLISPDLLNNFYCGIASNLQKLLKPSRDPLDYLSHINVPQSFVFLPTDINELKCTLLSIKNIKSSGEDELSARTFLNLPEPALQALADAINKSWEVGVFPSCLRSAKVIPIHKGGSLDDPSNFRPISLLATLSKVIEKLAKTRILSFLHANGILDECQFGFRKECGTSDAIYNLLHDLYSHINEGGVSAAVFCDLSKAFDCVSHEILLRKLYRYGFRGISLSWFSSFLLGRRQRVFIGSKGSNYQHIDWGVPQGSVLGPVLFLLYINDLANLLIRGKFTIFADDTTILWRALDSVSLHRIISEDLRLVKTWCDSNLLTLNPTKTKMVCFKCSLTDVFIDNASVEIASDSKFLGIYIDRDLKFNKHIHCLTSRLSSGCFAVRISVQELGPQIGRLVYYSLFESHLRYGIAFWGNATGYNLQMIFVLQKRAVRYICGVSPRDSCRPLFLREKILTVPSLYILETSCIIFKHQSSFVERSDRYPSRNHMNLRLPQPTSELTKKSVFYESLKIFNHLPLSIKSSPTLRMFKTKLKKLLVLKAYYSVVEFFEDIENGLE